MPFGLFMTVVGGGELFTGNTAVVTAAAIEGKASTGGLLKNWIFSYAGNFLGSVFQKPNRYGDNHDPWWHCDWVRAAPLIVSPQDL